MGAYTTCHDYSLFETSSNVASGSYGSPMRVLSTVALPSFVCYVTNATHSSSPTNQCKESTPTVNDCTPLLAFAVSNNSVREVDCAPDQSIEINPAMKECTVMDDCHAPNDTISASAKTACNVNDVIISTNVEKCDGDDMHSPSAVECSDGHQIVFKVNKHTSNVDVTSTSPPAVSNTLPTTLSTLFTYLFSVESPF